MSENAGFHVALVCVNEHAWDDAVPIEGLAICSVGVRLPGIGGGVVPAVLSEFGFGLFFEFAGV
jgi:hypothetical protein